MVGGNTLNDDKALAWYTPGKQYYDWGNTHQLAGSFDNFAKFFTQVAKDGKIGYVQPIGERAIPGQTVDANSQANFGVGAFLLAACEYVRYLGR